MTVASLKGPAGSESVTAYSVHDMFTVHEVYCRRDYLLPADASCIVDIGSNIGVSARYFRAQAPNAHVHLYEPVPFNVERLRQQLAGHEDFITVTEAAVADRAGRVSFGIEPSGRYCGIDLAGTEQIDVDCLEINDVLDRVLSESEEIDMLKIDTEGAEVATVNAIRPDYLRRIRAIRLETYEKPNPMPDVFRGSNRLMVRRLDRHQTTG